MFRPKILFDLAKPHPAERCRRNQRFLSPWADTRRRKRQVSQQLTRVSPSENIFSQSFCWKRTVFFPRSNSNPRLGRVPISSDVPLSQNSSESFWSIQQQRGTVASAIRLPNRMLAAATNGIQVLKIGFSAAFHSHLNFVQVISLSAKCRCQPWLFTKSPPFFLVETAVNGVIFAKKWCEN